MFKKVCIIGCGLIGSSLARAIKKNNLAEKIVSSNRSDATNKKVIELKIVDDSSSDTKKMVDGSDLVVIATPLSSYEDVISKIKNSLKNRVILTDVGSVKENIINLVEKNKIIANEPTANFFLMNFDKTNINSDEAFEKLASKRLILRKMAQYKIPNSLRLTIGNEQANEHFIQTIGSIIK